MNYPKLKNKRGIIKENIELVQFSIIESDNEKDIESHFNEYIKQIGWMQNLTYKRDKDIRNRYKFRNNLKKSTDGKPDYIFYDENENIIAICEVKSSKSGVYLGVDEAKDYVECINSDYGLSVRCAIGFDGKSFVMEYFGENGWERVTLVEQMPSLDVLEYIILSENQIEEVVETESIDRNLLANFFKRCDEIIRYSQIGSSPSEKFVELSTIIFLKMFSLKGYDKEFVNDLRWNSVWDIVLEGRSDIINTDFSDWLNQSYSNLYVGDNQNILIRIDRPSLIKVARLVDRVFGTYELTDFTNVKGDILEYFQSESKDRKIGEFFTPRHLIQYMVKLVGPSVFVKNNKVYIDKIYDPACGTGGFLIEAYNRYKNVYASEIKDLSLLKEGVLHGTELKANTALLAKLNMILIGDGHTNIVNANAFAYDKKELLPKKKDVFGNYIVIPESDVDFYLEGSEKKYFVKGDRTRKVTLEAHNKFYWLFDDFGQKIEVNENEIVSVERKMRSKDGCIVKKLNGKYYKQIPTRHFELKNDLEEDKIPYKYENIKAVNPLLKEEYIKLDKIQKPNPLYQKDFGNFDIVLANQPFGLSEPTKADYYFIKHMLESLHYGKKDETGRYGRVACIVDNGFLHDNNFLEERRELQESYTIKAVISLPQKIFAPYVQVIKSNILLIEKKKPIKGEKTYFVKVNHDGYSQDNKRNKEFHKDEFKRLLQLWRKWEDDYIVDPDTNEIIVESSHKELAGFAELHEIKPESWAVNYYLKYSVPAFNTKNVDLKDYITEINEKIHPIEFTSNEEDVVEIKGVSKKYGIITSDMKKALEYNQKYKVLDKEVLAYNPSRVNIGSIALNKETKGLISPSYVLFKVNEEFLPEYVMHYLKSEYGRKQIENFNNGTVRNSLSFEDLGKIVIPKMPVDEQERLLVLLSSVTTAKQNLLDSFNALLKYGIPDSSFEKYQEGIRFNEIELGEFIEESPNPSYGISLKSDNDEKGYPILKMNNIYPIMNELLNDDEIDRISLQKEDFDKYQLQNNDILINRTNSIDLVGKTGIFKWRDNQNNLVDCVYASYLMKVSIKTEYNPDYIAYFMNLSSTKDEIRKFAFQSNGQYNINLENLKKLIIKYPDDCMILDTYVKEFESYYLQLKNILDLSSILENEVDILFTKFLIG